MPCFSSVRTNLKNSDLLAQALKSLGYEVLEKTDTVVRAKKDNYIADFTRSNTADVFSTSSTSNLSEISKKYAEVGVRTWAKKNNYQVQSAEGNKITLVNRRS